jgi:hypothetical protein
MINQQLPNGRRRFLRICGGFAAGSVGTALLRGDQLPENANPRAISGDPAELNWEQRMSITDGARLVGNELRATRAALSRVDIRIAADVGNVEAVENVISGSATQIDDQRG